MELFLTIPHHLACHCFKEFDTTLHTISSPFIKHFEHLTQPTLNITNSVILTRLQPTSQQIHKSTLPSPGNQNFLCLTHPPNPSTPARSSSARNPTCSASISTTRKVPFASSVSNGTSNEYPSRQICRGRCHWPPSIQSRLPFLFNREYQRFTVVFFFDGVADFTMIGEGVVKETHPLDVDWLHHDKWRSSKRDSPPGCWLTSPW